MKRKSLRNFNTSMATHFPSMSNRVELNSNVQWFRHDIKLHVMPIGGKTHHKNFAVRLDGTKKDCERAEQLITDLGRHHFRDFKDNVCGAVEHLVWYLSTEGSAAYEIIRDENESIRLVNFTTKRLWRVAGYFLQFIPRSDRERWKKNIATLPDDRVWYVEIPTSLGGRNNYKKVIKQLRKFPTIAPDFWRDNLANELNSGIFNFQIYQNRSEVYWRRATKTWGWNRRDSSTDKTTEFFNYHKLICFAWAQAALREHIVLELNQLFVRFGLESELKIIGLPTTATIDQVKNEFIAGDVRVEDIYNRVKA